MGFGAADGSIYVIGGLTDPVEFKTALTSVIRADFQHSPVTWKSLAPLPRPLGLMSSVSLNGKLFIFGGRGPAGEVAADSADAFRYDPAIDRWIQLTPLPAARRGAAGVAVDDTHILIIGGCHGDEGSLVMLDEVLLYDVQADSYAECSRLPFAALCEQAVIWHENILVIGGEDKPRHRTDRVIIGKFAAVPRSATSDVHSQSHRKQAD
jgi:N-acetylneuraminic acid mutarotase